MKNLFVNGLNNYTFYEEVSSAVVESGLIGEGAISLLEKEINTRLSALQVEFCYVSDSCISCTFTTPSSKFILALTFNDIFEFLLCVTHILIAYSLGKGYKVDLGV